MKSYIRKIINYFFYHEVSDELTGRVHQRMVFPAEDKERDKALSGIWEELDSVSCPDEKTERAFRKLEDTIRPGKEIKFRIQTGKTNWWKIAAVWIIPFIMLGTSTYLYYKTVSLESQRLPEVSYIQHYTPLGTREELTLPDGTQAWLNAGSLLVYPSEFVGDKRNVFIYGEGFFDVVEDPVHPFIVNAGGLQLKVLGTTFNISAYLDDLQIKATLETGQIQIKVPGHEKEYTLYPDDQLIYTPLTGLVEQIKVKATDHSDWRMGGLNFNDTSFVDIIPILERTYGVTFHIMDSRYMNQRIRVHFNKNESLENIMGLLRVLIPGMEYKMDGANVYVR